MREFRDDDGYLAWLSYGKSGHWNPADHMCVAGELLVATRRGPHWAIKGEIVELAR